jgi:hypothetical protein
LLCLAVPAARLLVVTNMRAVSSPLPHAREEEEKTRRRGGPLVSSLLQLLLLQARAT